MRVYRSNRMSAKSTSNQASDPHTRRVTRLAPSPTGALHLGNARTFLINWAIARQHGWHIVLRIEDLDTPRVKPGAIEDTIDVLAWLGMDWDEGPILQSDDSDSCSNAMRALATAGLVYPCDLTRAQVEEAATAPHANQHETIFPTSLRPEVHPREFDDPETNWRLVIPEEPISFVDAFHGPQRFDLESTIGDFVIWTKRGQPAYQLNVVVDDHRQGVTEVVRGDDLLRSAARQIHVYRSLGLDPIPRYTHLPLVQGEDGRRLAKRHGDTRVSSYRDQGVPASRLVSLIARWSGVPREFWEDGRLDASGFVKAFDLATMPAEAVTFTEEDDRWLLSASV